MKELALINCRLDGRYDIRSLLGRGSYAEIYVARDILAAPQSPHNLVVIKALNVFLQDDLDDDLERTLVENFQNEAVALDRVRHPNIISRLGHGTARDLKNLIFHDLVLEYLPGGDLAKVCRERKLPISQALYYLEQVCAGLEHAHKNGIIHRDIKPQNLLLTEDRKTVKIADFGVARFDQSDSPITRVGTNIYAPPEHSPMFTGNSETPVQTGLTPAADIYSLAKSTYVLATSESPRFFANQPITELPQVVRHEPWAEKLLQILKKATQNEPQQRHQTVKEFWQDLSNLRTSIENERGEITTQVAKRRNNLAPQPHVARGYTPLAPQLPRFNTSRNLKLNPNLMPIGANPNLVVRLDEQKLYKPPSQQPLPAPVQAEKQPVVAEELPPVKPKPKFLRRLTIVLITLSLFVGILFLTDYYFRGRALWGAITSPAGKQEAVALMDINLRADSNRNSEQIGLVTKDSRIQILETDGNWHRIAIIEQGSKPNFGNSANQGWISGKAGNGEDTIKIQR